MGIKRFPAVTGSLFFYPHFAIYMNSSIPKPSIFVAKKRYGRFLNFADRIERSSEDNKEHNRLDPHAQEEKRMNFVRKYAYN